MTALKAIVVNSYTLCNIQSLDAIILKRKHIQKYNYESIVINTVDDCICRNML